MTTEARVPASDDRLAAVARLLRDAVLLGAEVDVRYRVLALTVEPTADAHPDGPARGRPDATPPADGAVVDPRLQVLLHPASTFLASLRVEDGDDRRVEAFGVEQLPDVVHALDGPVMADPVFGLPRPAEGEWGPRPSLEGRSSAPDGTFHRLRVEATRGARRFGLFATFDDVEVRRPDGSEVELPDAGGSGAAAILGL